MKDPDPVPTQYEPAALPSRYRRDIRVENVILNQTDLVNLISIIQNKTNDAQRLHIKSIGPASLDEQKELEEDIQRVFRISYNIMDFEDNSFSGYDTINTNSGDFPDKIKSVYISNSEAFKEAANGRLPQNSVDIFIDFKRPSMAINFFNLPSNPTENNSIANVYGLNEDWVISTHQKVREFFDKRKTKRSFIHRSGIYDLFLLGVYIPILLWVAFRIESKFPNAIKESSIVSLIAIYAYGVLLSLMLGRVIFQYLRWLFPIVEYDSKRSIAPQIRGVIGIILLGLGTAFFYDIIRTVFF